MNIKISTFFTDALIVTYRKFQDYYVTIAKFGLWQ